MHKLSPIARAALFLIFLGIIAQFKGCLHIQDAETAMKYSRPEPEAAEAFAVKVNRSLMAGDRWYMVRTILLGLGLMVGLLAYRNRVLNRKLAASRPPPPPPKEKPRYQMRPFRRRK